MSAADKLASSFISPTVAASPSRSFNLTVPEPRNDGDLLCSAPGAKSEAASLGGLAPSWSAADRGLAVSRTDGALAAKTMQSSDH